MSSTAKAQLFLEAAIERVEKALPGSAGSGLTGSWESYEATRHFAEEAVERAYPNRSNEAGRLRRALWFSDEDIRDDAVALLRDRVASLRRGLAVLKSQLEVEQKLVAVPSEIMDGARRATSSSSQKVFLVHGRDDQWTETVNMFVSEAGMDVVVLREQPGGARTIIEKLEANSDVGFAIVLLTADDQGGLAGDALRPRARQNVVFELGYFIGLISRSRVVALLEPDVEVFSDIAGVQYIELDSEERWKSMLKRELKHAGLSVK